MIVCLFVLFLLAIVLSVVRFASSSLHLLVSSNSSYGTRDISNKNVDIKATPRVHLWCFSLHIIMIYPALDLFEQW